MPQSIGTPALWGGFVAMMFVLMAVEITAVRRNPHDMSMREASAWTAGWITLALLFGAGIAWHFGRRPALEYVTGYVIEYALSVDNLFVFILIFKTFGVPSTYQRPVLLWGILGAMVLRAVFILAGAALLSRFNGLLYVFGAFLIYTGGKILLGKDVETHPEQNPVLKLFGKVFPVVRHFGDGNFIVKHHGRWYATALLPVMLVVEATDVVFAVDSIPAPKRSARVIHPAVHAEASRIDMSCGFLRIAVISTAIRTNIMATKPPQSAGVPIDCGNPWTLPHRYHERVTLLAV